MKICLLLCFCSIKLLCSAQQKRLIESEFFNPAFDPVASMVNNRLRLVVSEEVLVRSIVVNESVQTTSDEPLLSIVRLK